MIASGFQFTNPVLDRLVFEINKDFNLKENEGIEIEIKSEINVKRVENQKEAVVELNIVIGEKENAPFLVDAIQKAKFRWNEEDENKVERLLRQNAPALLLSYLRPVIANITSASQYPTYNLPFMNFTQELK